ncbi:MAG: glycine oxidase [Fimbriimonadaceae bacterium]|jgi:glycine oxidase|nr:glycine oxidase [Fimbriimonadaceae bacterium]
MLAPLAESDEIGPMYHLGKASLDLYPSFLEQLNFDSEIEVVLEGPGLLRLVFTGAEADSFRRLAESRGGKNLQVEWLDAAQLEDLQPNIDQGVLGGIRSSREQHVNPRRLMQALQRACERQRVSFMEGIHADRASQAINLDIKTIYAAGAWTGELLASKGVHVPVRPVKGQVVMLQQPSHDLRYTLYGAGSYLVPRDDGSVLVGATSEEAGFDERITDEAIEALLEKAVDLYPPAKEFTFTDTWASLRPGTPDDMPVMGRLPTLGNAYVASGHYRNGILLAPITAKLMAELVINGKEPEMLAPFSPARFAEAGVA